MKKQRNQMNDQKSLGYQKQAQEAFIFLSENDLIHKGFLRPVEILLRQKNVKIQRSQYSRINQSFSSQNLKPNMTMPQGLDIVIKENISNNKYTLGQFTQIDFHQIKRITSTNFIGMNCNNLLSLMKNQFGIELAVCICMYTEDKAMLKKTLKGISQNMEHFIRAGVNTDNIAIFVILDGIQKVDSSVVDYFDELQQESNILLSQDSQPITVKQLLQKRQNFNDDQELTNVNHLLFTEEQYQERKRRRFKSRHDEYKYIKQLLKKIQEQIKDKNLNYQRLQIKTQQFFIQITKQTYLSKYGVKQNEMQERNDDFYLSQYIYDISKSRPIIMEALYRTKKYCQEYIKSRDNMSFLCYYRTSIEVKKVKNNNKTNLQGSSRYLQQNEDYDSDDESGEFIRQKKQKMNIFLCTKYKNSGKLSSHNWFFNGFCKQLNPNYTILLDVGLRPHKQALFKMYQYMKNHQRVGGVCGYMALRIQRAKDQAGYNKQFDENKDVDFITRMALKVVDIQRAQQMEYHLAHFIDKPFEAQFNFIHVLPGAFSAYNMKALNKQNDDRGQQSNILQDYFQSLRGKKGSLKSIKFSAFQILSKILLPDIIFYYIWPLLKDSQEQCLYDQNIYLAEDRILSMGIHQNGFDIVYLPDAYAWVDPITNLHALLGQRKRWINGSFFAFEKVKKLQNARKCEPLLSFQFFILTLMNTMAYVSPALYLFTISVALQVIKFDVFYVIKNNIPLVVVQGFQFFINFGFVFIMLAIVFYSMFLNSKDQNFKPFIYGASTMMGLISIIVFIILLVDIFRGNKQFLVSEKQFTKSTINLKLLQLMRWIIISIIGLYSLPIIIYSVLYKSFIVDIIFSVFSFVYFSPTYLNILNIYALSRINDTSWGTKGLDQVSGSQNTQILQTWNLIRLLHVGKYLLWNTITCMLLYQLGNEYTSRFWVTFVIIIILFSVLLIKILFGSFYLIKYCCFQKNVQYQVTNNSSNITIQDKFTALKSIIEKDIKNNIVSLIKINSDKQGTNINISSSRFTLAMSKILKRQKIDKQAYLNKKNNHNDKKNPDKEREGLKNKLYQKANEISKK